MAMDGGAVVIDISAEFHDQTDPGLNQAKKKTDKFTESIKKSKEQLQQLNSKKWQVALEAKDKASAAIKKAITEAKKFGGKAFSAIIKVKDMASAPLRSIIRMLKSPVLLAGAVIGLSFGLGDMINTYSTFEQSMANAASISQATGDEFLRMENLAKKMGRETVFSASQAADALYYMASAGYKAEQMEQSLGGILNLASATQTELADTTDVVISTLNMFQLKSSESSRVADVFASSIGNSQATMAKLSDSMRYVGPVANSLNYKLEDTVAALSILYDSGFRGEQAGTALRGGLSKLLDPTKDMISTLGELGLTYDRINPQTHSLAEIMGVLHDKSLSTSQAVALFGTEAGPGMIQLVQAGQKKIESFTKTLQNSGGTADKMAKRQLNTLQGAFKLLKSAAEDVQIVVGERLKPHLASFTEWLTSKMPDLSRQVNSVMDSVDRKIEQISGTIRDFTSSNEWKSADLGGKIAIAWDKIVAEPFDSWWESTGRQWLTDKSKEMGNSLGKGLTSGLLTLLGVDVQSAVADGTTIGKSFAQGFIEGFDGKAVGEALLNAAKGVFQDAGKVLPGGEQASSTSWLSAGLLTLAFGKIGGFKLLGKLGGLLTKGTSSAGTGSSLLTNTAVMNVKAGIVNLSGGLGGLGGKGGSGSSGIPIPSGGSTSGKPLSLPSTGGSSAASGGGAAAGGATSGAAALGTVAAGALFLSTFASVIKGEEDRFAETKLKDYEEGKLKLDEEAIKDSLIKAYESDELESALNKAFNSLTNSTGNLVAEAVLDKLFPGFADNYTPDKIYEGGLNESKMAEVLKPMIGADIAAQPHANGGILTRPHVGLVAEDGDEAIIPLAPSHRNRGLSIWKEAGERLGIGSRAGGSISGTTASSGNHPIVIQLGGIHFEISGESDPQKVMDIIRQNLGDITDELCRKIYESLREVFGNMPIVSAGL